MIEYLHTGCCRMTPLTLPGLVSLAEYLDLTDLQQACFDRLSDAVCMDTVSSSMVSQGSFCCLTVCNICRFAMCYRAWEDTCHFNQHRPCLRG